MRRLAALVALLLVAAVRADACCMVPVVYRGDVDQSWQRGVVVHDGGHEELILRIRPHFHGQDGPAYLEWVVTVPSTPTGYAVVAPGGGAPPASAADAPRRRWEEPPPLLDAEGRQDFVDEIVRLHDRLQELASSQFERRTRFEVHLPSKEAAITAEVPSMSAAASGLEIDAAVRVGPFEITPVRARGPEGLAELNAYLQGRGFAPEDPDHMRWFTERKFTFLCIHITPPENQASVGKVLDLPALRIGFDSDTPYYPAKFSSRQGNWGLRLAVVTSRPLALERLNAVRRRLHAYEAPRWENLWSEGKPPRAVAEAFPAGGPRTLPKRRYVNLIESSGVNPLVDGKPEIWSWDDDVFLPLGGDADAPAWWYYGDGDISAPERFVREQGLGAGTAAVVVGVPVFLVWRARRRRRRAT